MCLQYVLIPLPSLHCGKSRFASPGYIFCLQPCKICALNVTWTLVNLCRILENMTGYQIVVEELREHVLDTSGDVDPSK